MYGCIEKKNFIFLVALFFEVLAMLISITTLPYMVDNDACNLVLKILRYIGYLIVTIKIFLDDYTTKEICLIIIIIMLLLLNSISVGGNAVLCLFLFVIGMKGIDFNKVARSMLVWFLIGLIVTIAASQIGVIENWSYNSAGRERVSLGYFYPSHATSTIFYCVCLLCFVLGNKLKLWHVFLIEVFNIWQYKATDARAGTLMMLFVPIMFYLFKYIRGDINKKPIVKLFVLAFPVSALFSFFTAIFYNGQGLLLKLNSLISNRLYLANRALQEYGITLFGERIDWIGNGGVGHIKRSLEGEYNYVDCSYIKIMFDYGIVICAIVVVGFTIASIVAVKKNNKYLLLALSFVAVYSIIEPRLIEIGFNPFVLILVALIDTSSIACERSYEPSKT